MQVYAMDISRDNETPGVFIYATDISPAFLARFEHPAACAAPAAGPLEIRRTWLPYDLKLNPFLDRLHAALVPPAV
ncbi:uncharacterized protein E0L32_008763 [Thyridium curvatum]|uniref:Uncharacterized protein n=1 Tax=Thyridium curvatum TaxID=1093900 RepID=A0A507B042_9PEZI|nr:uncharacterized protein E0L32_008763 [Thyridium curvatum]TPX10358.1 hypothetical protein E0L32_008763 [Thyridium curvatum]